MEAVNPKKRRMLNYVVDEDQTTAAETTVQVNEKATGTTTAHTTTNANEEARPPKKRFAAATDDGADEADTTAAEITAPTTAETIKESTAETVQFLAADYLSYEIDKTAPEKITQNTAPTAQETTAPIATEMNVEAIAPTTVDATPPTATEMNVETIAPTAAKTTAPTTGETITAETVQSLVADYLSYEIEKTAAGIISQNTTPTAQEAIAPIATEMNVEAIAPTTVDATPPTATEMNVETIAPTAAETTAPTTGETKTVETVQCLVADYLSYEIEKTAAGKISQNTTPTAQETIAPIATEMDVEAIAPTTVDATPPTATEMNVETIAPTAAETTAPTTGETKTVETVQCLVADYLSYEIEKTAAGNISQNTTPTAQETIAPIATEMNVEAIAPTTVDATTPTATEMNVETIAPTAAETTAPTTGETITAETVQSLVADYLSYEIKKTAAETISQNTAPTAQETTAPIATEMNVEAIAPTTVDATTPTATEMNVETIAPTAAETTAPTTGETITAETVQSLVADYLSYEIKKTAAGKISQNTAPTAQETTAPTATEMTAEATVPEMIMEVTVETTTPTTAEATAPIATEMSAETTAPKFIDVEITIIVRTLPLDAEKNGQTEPGMIVEIIMKRISPAAAAAATDMHVDSTAPIHVQINRPTTTQTTARANAKSIAPITVQAAAETRKRTAPTAKRITTPSTVRTGPPKKRFALTADYVANETHTNTAQTIEITALSATKKREQRNTQSTANTRPPKKRFASAYYVADDAETTTAETSPPKKRFTSATHLARIASTLQTSTFSEYFSIPDSSQCPPAQDSSTKSISIATALQFPAQLISLTSEERQMYMIQQLIAERVRTMRRDNVIIMKSPTPHPQEFEICFTIVAVTNFEDSASKDVGTTSLYQAISKVQTPECSELCSLILDKLIKNNLRRLLRENKSASRIAPARLVCIKKQNVAYARYLERDLINTILGYRRNIKWRKDIDSMDKENLVLMFGDVEKKPTYVASEVSSDLAQRQEKSTQLFDTIFNRLSKESSKKRKLSETPDEFGPKTKKMMAAEKLREMEKRVHFQPERKKKRSHQDESFDQLPTYTIEPQGPEIPCKDYLQIDWWMYPTGCCVRKLLPRVSNSRQSNSTDSRVLCPDDFIYFFAENKTKTAEEDIREKYHELLREQLNLLMTAARSEPEDV